MNFLCFGNKNNKSILFIHGMASTAKLCYEPILKQLADYYVILAEVDGHSEQTKELISLEENCDEIEDYIINNLSGNLYCLSGFSMGATMAVEIIGRGNVNVTKTHLDAAFLIKMGLLTKPYTYIFCKAIKRMQTGKAIPKFIMDAVMGKDNNSVREMLYLPITSGTIKNACEFVYKYNIPEKIRNYRGTVLFWRGSNEPYPEKSVDLLKKYLPDLIDIEIENMGHGQYLHEHSDEYAGKLIEYLQN
ncbi:alpha/beta hydrolase [Lachnospiraceae bacterium]|nr:alpha/beta hydrolase [Lachnospiraceae bacterium]